jgi:predicted nuclease of predicted toxin-antitoxin system
MKFKTDENLPTEAADLLRSAGHDAVTVGEQRLSGSIDSAIGSVCEREHRVLVTLDLGFADIQTYPPGRYPGFVVLRLARQDKASVLRAIGRAHGAATNRLRSRAGLALTGIRRPAAVWEHGRRRRRTGTGRQ